MNLFESIHILAGVLLCGLLALILTFSLSEPGVKAMDTGEQYSRGFRNLFFNIFCFSSITLLIKIVVDWYSNYVFGSSLNNEAWSLFWLVLTIITGIVWTNVGNLIRTPPTNSVILTTNRIRQRKMKLPKNLGEIDWAVIYQGPIFAILHIFEQFQDEIQVESRPNIVIKIDELTFKDTTGSADLVVGFVVRNPNVFASRGTTPDLQEKSVREIVSAMLEKRIETIAAKNGILEVKEDPDKFFKPLSDYFAEKQEEIEELLGVEITLLLLTRLTLSASGRKVKDGNFINSNLDQQAKNMVEASQGKMEFSVARELAAATTNPNNNFQYHIFRGLSGSKALVGADGNLTQVETN